MATDTAERPTVQEQYEVASNTSDLRVEAEKWGSGEVMIAGGYASGVDAHGMSPTRLGMALLRLHSEWSSAAKPHRLNERQVEALTASMKAQDATDRANREHGNGELARLEALRAAALGKGEQPPFDLLVAITEQRTLYDSGALPLPASTAKGKPEDRARAEADRWFANELRMLALDLRSRALVWTAVAPWADSKGISHAVAAEAILHWLHPVCPVCDGHGLRKVPNAPALSARQCHKCSGTGNRPHPQGSGKLLAHMDYCIGLARGSLKQRLRRER